MRKVFGIATLALGPALFSTPALADDAPAGGGASTSAAPAAPAASADDDGKKIGVGGDLLFTIPVGDLADGSGPLIGASLRGGYYVMPTFEAYLRVGYQLGLKKSQGNVLGNEVKTGINDIPIMLGGRYFFMQPYSGLYGNLEIGMNMMVPTASVGSQSNTGDTQTRFGANIGGGYVISKELPINIGAQLAIMNLIGKNSGESTLIGINILAGYEARF